MTRDIIILSNFINKLNILTRRICLQLRFSFPTSQASFILFFFKFFSTSWPGNKKVYCFHIGKHIHSGWIVCEILNVCSCCRLACLQGENTLQAIVVGVISARPGVSCAAHSRAIYHNDVSFPAGTLRMDREMRLRLVSTSITLTLTLWFTLTTSAGSLTKRSASWLI